VKAFNWKHWKEKNKAAGPDFDPAIYASKERELFERLREKQRSVVGDELGELKIDAEKGNPRNWPFEFYINIPDGSKQRLVNALRVGPKEHLFMFTRDILLINSDIDKKPTESEMKWLTIEATNDRFDKIFTTSFCNDQSATTNDRLFVAYGMRTETSWSEDKTGFDPRELP